MGENLGKEKSVLQTPPQRRKAIRRPSKMLTNPPLDSVEERLSPTQSPWEEAAVPAEIQTKLGVPPNHKGSVDDEAAEAVAKHRSCPRSEVSEERRRLGVGTLGFLPSDDSRRPVRSSTPHLAVGGWLDVPKLES